MNKKGLKFYRVDNFKGDPAFLVPAALTLSQLIQKISQQHPLESFQVFLDSEMLESNHKSLSLEQIVKHRPKSNNDAPPTFYIIDFPCESAEDEEMHAYYSAIADLLNIEGSVKTEWKGANGHVLFEGRDNSLMASSCTKASRLHKSSSKYSLNVGQLLSEGQEFKQQKNIKAQTEEVKRLIAALKEKKTKQELMEHRQKQQVSHKYSNYDINFVTTLQKTYLQYSLRSGRKLAYVSYKDISFGVIQRKIGKNDVIGVIGDFGTGLDDSYELLQNMVEKCGVNIILHLGDVYYAGTPEEYENNITVFIKKLRTKTKRQLLFYSIPGNHDYYSWGMPFLCFIKAINQEQFTKQRASYFCLRSQDNKWQFLGADTAYHDSSPFDQINQINAGPRLRREQLAWHKDKLENFEGSTIFLTHHQLFSIHDRLCGSLSTYRAFSCINPMLSKQLFEYMPYFSAWFWGHQHSFMMFRDDFWGVPRCRLLGNSSFHVIYEKEHPYHRNPSFPRIPFIEPDEVYLKKYLPVAPGGLKEPYFNLSFAVINMRLGQENLLIQYYCSPCYTQSSQKERHFKPYKMHEEPIKSKASIINSSQPIVPNQTIYIKSELGLLLAEVEGNFELNFIGSSIKIIPFKQHHVIEEMVPVYLTIGSKYSQFLSSKGQRVTLQSQPSDRSIWTLKKSLGIKDTKSAVTNLNTLSIRNQCELSFLGFQAGFNTPRVVMTKNLALWQCLRVDGVIPM